MAFERHGPSFGDRATTKSKSAIVQRVPVRIKLSQAAVLNRLRPGLSVSATVELVPPTAAQLAALR